MPKLMPSLRHTKSEEHLDSTISSKNTENGGNGVQPQQPQPPPPSTSTTKQQQQISVKIESIENNAAEQTNAVVAVHREWNEQGMTEDDVWSQEDDEITAQYLKLHKMCERDAVSQMSLDSIDSREQSMCDTFFLSIENCDVKCVFLFFIFFF